MMPTDANERQESASLRNIDDLFKKIIVVNDNIMPKHDEAGITTIGLLDFLLQPLQPLLVTTFFEYKSFL